MIHSQKSTRVMKGEPRRLQWNAVGRWKADGKKDPAADVEQESTRRLDETRLFCRDDLCRKDVDSVSDPGAKLCGKSLSEVFAGAYVDPRRLHSCPHGAKSSRIVEGGYYHHIRLILR
jgi:hypothetical protein